MEATFSSSAPRPATPEVIAPAVAPVSEFGASSDAYVTSTLRKNPVRIIVFNALYTDIAPERSKYLKERDETQCCDDDKGAFSVGNCNIPTSITYLDAVYHDENGMLITAFKTGFLIGNGSAHFDCPSDQVTIRYSTTYQEKTDFFDSDLDKMDCSERMSQLVQGAIAKDNSLRGHFRHSARRGVDLTYAKHPYSRHAELTKIPAELREQIRGIRSEFEAIVKKETQKEQVKIAQVGEDSEIKPVRLNITEGTNHLQITICNDGIKI